MLGGLISMELLQDIIVSPVVVFALMLLVAYALYRLGGRMAPKLNDVGGKLKAYACGEDIPGVSVQPTYQVFHVAFFFTILHVSVLIIATVPGGNIALLGAGYIAVLAISIYALMRR